MSGAIAKAARYLEEWLTPEQAAEYKATGRFNVVNGDKRYRIGYDLQVRVYDINDHENAPPLEVWCVFEPNTPYPDTILLQLKYLRSNPAKLRRMASVTRLQNMRANRLAARRILANAGYISTPDRNPGFQATWGCPTGPPGPRLDPPWDPE